MVRFRPEAPIKYADVAHLVECHLAKVEVAGSSPVIRSKGEERVPKVLSLLSIQKASKRMTGCDSKETDTSYPITARRKR